MITVPSSGSRIQAKNDHCTCAKLAGEHGVRCAFSPPSPPPTPPPLRPTCRRRHWYCRCRRCRHRGDRSHIAQDHAHLLVPVGCHRHPPRLPAHWGTRGIGRHPSPALAAPATGGALVLYSRAMIRRRVGGINHSHAAASVLPYPAPAAAESLYPCYCPVSLPPRALSSSQPPTYSALPASP
jgi:hypothetical protein